MGRSRTIRLRQGFRRRFAMADKPADEGRLGLIEIEVWEGSAIIKAFRLPEGGRKFGTNR